MLLNTAASEAFDSEGVETQGQGYLAGFTLLGCIFVVLFIQAKILIMQTGLLHLHNILRWAVLLFGLLTLFTAARGLGGKKLFTAGDKRTALYLLISCDVQLLLGLVLYYLKGYLQNYTGGTMGAVMKSPVARFWTIEHGPVMILAIVLVHIGYAGTKGKRADKAKFSRLFWCTLAALLIIVACIPWPFRESVGRGLFPGM